MFQPATLRNWGKKLLSVLLDSQLAAVVTTLTTYSVQLDCCATVLANTKSRCYCLVVCTTLCGTCLRMVSFRMCHFAIKLKMLLFYLYNALASRYIYYFLSIKSLRAAQRGSMVSSSLAALLSSSTIYSFTLASISGLQVGLPFSSSGCSIRIGRVTAMNS